MRIREEAEKRLDAIELRPGMEPLTPEEKERFSGARPGAGASLTSEEQYALFGPPPEAKARSATYTDVAPMEAAELARRTTWPGWPPISFLNWARRRAATAAPGARRDLRF